MHLHSIFLAMAAPVAVSTVRSIGTMTSHARESFAQVLEGATTDGTNSAEAASAAKHHKGSVSEQLESIANRLRHWLDEHGLHRPFELNLSMDAGGEEHLDVAGDEAKTVRELVDQLPDLRSQLRDLAASLQALTGGLGSGAVNLMINEQSSSARSI